MDGKVITAILGSILGAVIGFLLGNANKLFIDPVIELKKVINECLFVLMFRANYLCNPLFPTSQEYCNAKNAKNSLGEQIEEYEKAAFDLRIAASKLKIATNSIICYRLFSICRIVPQQKDVQEAAAAMIGLSNSTPTGHSQQNREIRSKCLRLLGTKELN